MLRKSVKVPRRFTRILLLLTMLCIVSCNTSPGNPFLEGFKLEGFEQASALVVYNKDNIFGYLNGEAEVYLSLGFQLLYMVSFREREGGAQMIMEAYDMETPRGAKGVFGKYIHEAGAPIQGFGESAWTDNHIVLFQRGKYFLRVLPDPSLESETKPNKYNMVSLSQILDVTLEKRDGSIQISKDFKL